MISSIRWWRGVVAVGAVTLVFGASAASATTPPAEPSQPTPVASSLTNPRGFTWNEDGQLVVAMAGSGGESPPTEDTPTNAIIGPFAGGTTGAVVSIDASGCPAALVTGLASSLTATGEVLGAEDVAYLDGDLYIGVDGGGAGHGNADVPSGVYRMADDGSAELVADLSAWTRDNPVAAIPGDFDPDAGGYSLVVEPESGTLWVDDPNSGQILSVATDGTISRVVDLSDPHKVPTRLALDPAGGVYVGTLTPVPFADGTAEVIHVATDGTAETVWTGLTTVADIAVGDDGTLYALELSTGNTAEPPFLTPGSGRIVRQTGPDTAEPVAEGLMLPIAMELGPDGAFYVSTPAIGANDGTGAIVRIDPAGGAPTGSTPTGSCAPIEGTTGTMPPPPPAGTAPTGSPPSPPPSPPAPPPATEATVTIQDFAFGPAELSVAAGTTVTFVNNDSAPHTATADDGSWDAGEIAPGESATVTLDTAGSFAFHCEFHPNMTATLTVT
jgi:plastocyanin